MLGTPNAPAPAGEDEKFKAVRRLLLRNGGNSQIGQGIREEGLCSSFLDSLPPLDFLPDPSAISPHPLPAPRFDLSFLGPRGPQGWAAETVAELRNDGRQWLQDSLSSLYISLAPCHGLPRIQACISRSTEPLLAFFLPAEEGFGWDIEVQAQQHAADARLCDVVVGVRHPGGLSPEGVEVTIRYSIGGQGLAAGGDCAPHADDAPGCDADEEWEIVVAGADGRLVFADVPIAALDTLTLHVCTQSV
jgi:hypothetical protein